MALVQTDMEARQLLQSFAAVELYQAQIEVAKYLELAYHGFSDHPDVAEEVRLTAHSARNQHIMTVGLMKSFMVTAKHIVSTMIPMILDAVDLEDKDLVRDCFSPVITRAEEMKTEAMDTRQKYCVISSKNLENLTKVSNKNKFVTDEQQRIAIEKEQSEKLAEDAKGSEEELKKEKQKMEEDLKQLKSYRDKWMESTESLWDVRSLVEASARLGDVERQFSRIIQFWDNMEATLKSLKDDTWVGEIYLKKLEHPKHAERLMASIQRAEHGWKTFGKICRDYVDACENVDIKVLYNFLSTAPDDVPRHAREACMRAIESEIEENIKIDEECDAE